MKKISNKLSLALVLSALVATSAITVNASENLNGNLSQTTYKTEQANIRQQKIIINDKVLQDFPVSINNCTLVPAREVSDNLGFKISWNKEEQSATINSDTMESTVYLGVDMYSAHSTVAIGATAPIKFGVAPILINNKLYIPAEIFRIIQGNNPNAVLIDNDKIIINHVK